MTSHKNVPKGINVDSLNSKPAVYVLLCEGQNYYIGSTRNLFRRIAEHVSGNGSEWTEKHPVTEIVEKREVDEGRLFSVENALTIKYMKEHDVSSVRGSKWAAVDLDKCPQLPDKVIAENEPDMKSLSSIAETYCSD